MSSKVLENPSGLGLHTIKQYHIPLYLSYHHLLENATTYFIPKIGVTLTSHSEEINPANFIVRGERVALNNNYLHTLYYSVSTETPILKNNTVSLSGGVALKFTKPKIGEAEIGLSVIYNIKNPTAKYTIKTIKYDDENDISLSEEI
ncbi:MAG: hypothetical protein JKX68_02790, partial [Flavobacteriales bacterium]|nr:hypothetical protein [Flavobacteriales bacterium]